MKLKYLLFTFLVFFLLLSSSSYLQAAPAPIIQTASCTTATPPASENCFNGFERDFGSGGLTSIYADIYTPKTYPDNYASSGSNAWPMIYDGTKYVQVGWITSNSMNGNYGNTIISIPNGVHYFYEINYGVANSDYQVYNTNGPATDTTHGYRVTLGSDGYWTGTVDGVQISAFANQISSTQYYFSGTIAQYCEELNSGGKDAYNSAFAGTAINHAKFSNLRAFQNNITYYSPIPTTIFQDTNAGQNITSHYGDTSIYPDQSNSYVEYWDTRK